jgi:hypothetical protein
MTAWTEAEFNQNRKAEELQNVSLRRVGILRKPVILGSRAVTKKCTGEIRADAYGKGAAHSVSLVRGLL